jgi:hypothetical protein
VGRQPRSAGAGRIEGRAVTGVRIVRRHRSITAFGDSVAGGSGVLVLRGSQADISENTINENFA